MVHKLVHIVDRTNRNNCVTLLRYNVDKPESSYAQSRLFEIKEEHEKLQQTVYVKYKIEDFLYTLDVIHSVYEKVDTNPPKEKIV